MKLRRNKKGFTIVELVIVIAVIGILAAVLIPVFVNLTNKANRASDESLVKNLNTSLAMKEQDPVEKGGGKNATMHDAVEDLKEYGYLLPNLVTKAEDKLLWNQKTNRFILEDGDKQDYKDIDFWRIQDSVKGDEVYSVYAGVDFKGNGLTEDIVNVKVGFDTGYHEDIAEVNYVRSGQAQEVIIRTSEGTLNVNAPNDTVHHYSFLHELDIVAIANASYHEHGTVLGGATIAQGHIVLEEGSNVPTVEVINATGGVTVTANESTIITVDSSSASNTSIVSNSEDVFVDGVDASAVSGTQASDVVFPTDIDSEAKLKNVLDNGGLAKLTADIALTQNNYSYVRSELAGSYTEEASLGTNKNVVLNLNGHNITGEDLDDDINFFAIDNNGSIKVYDNSSTEGKIIANAKMFYVRGELEVINGEFVSTVLTAGTDFRSMIIADQNSSIMIHDGKFYTPKCVITSWGSVTVDDGEFVCASASTGWQNAKGQSSFAYTLRLMDGVNYVNGGEFYGIHGALSCEGGKSTIANVYSEASEETLAKFGAYVEANNIKIHVLGNRAGEFLVDSDFVAAKKASFKSSVHYGLYVCGEYNIVYATVNSGTFKSSDKNACLVGNNNDGGKGLYAHTTINDGTFIGASGKESIRETGITISYGAGYTEIFGGVFSTDVTSLMKDTANYQCVKQSDNTWKVSKK